MTPFVMFQITSLMCFLYAARVKMWKVNKIGFITITIMAISSIIPFFEPLKNYESLQYLILSFLIVFITAFHTYKKITKFKEFKDGYF